MHFINPGTTVEYPKIKVNLLFAKNVMYQAGTMVSFNSQINIPAATAAGPGTQTVNGTCTAPAGAKFFTMSTHTHKHATAAWVDYIHAGTTTEIVHTGTASTYPADQEQGSGADWEHPGVGLWTAPNFLTVQSGDSFTYHCSYTQHGLHAGHRGRDRRVQRDVHGDRLLLPGGIGLLQLTNPVAARDAIWQ